MNKDTTREDIIDLIELRIQAEFQKHQDSLGTIDCSKIAARKIASSLFMIYDIKEKSEEVQTECVTVDPEFEHIQEEYATLCYRLWQDSDDPDISYIEERIEQIRKDYPGIANFF